MLAILLAACSDDTAPAVATPTGDAESESDSDTTVGAESESDSDTTASDADPVKIGVLGDRSGGASFYSNLQLQGIELAVDEINGAGGVLGRPIEIVYTDDGNDPTVAPLRFQEMVEDGVVGVIMTSGSASSLQAKATATELEVPSVICCNLSPDVYREPNNEFVVLQGNDAIHVTVALIQAMSDFEAIGIYTDTSATGQGLAEAYRSGIEDNSEIEVATVEALDIGATDATAIVERFRDSGVGAILISGQSAPEQAVFVRAVLDQGLDVSLFQDITGGVPAYWELAGADALAQVTYVDQLHPENEMTARVESLYSEAYPEEALVAATPLGWSSLYLLTDAIERAGSVEGVAVRDALKETSGLEVWWGPPGYSLDCSQELPICSSLEGMVLRGFQDGRPGPAVD